jgi:heptosyltransferase I
MSGLASRPVPSKRSVDELAPRVLVVRLSAIGDVLHALPAVAALRRHAPDAVVDFLVEDRAADLVRGSPDVDRVVVFPRAALRAALSARRLSQARRTLAAFLRELRARDYDAVVDLQGNLKSGVLGLLARAGRRVGLARRDAREGNALLSTDRAPRSPAGAHRVERALRLASHAVGADLSYVAPRLPDTSDLAADVDERLAAVGLDRRGFVALHPGTSGFGAFKRWPPERFSRLADLLATREGRPVAVLCAPGEEALAHAVRAASRSAPAVVSTPSLRHLSETLSRAALLVAADTGPLHLAAALGVPVVGLYGPKDPSVYGPYGLDAGGVPGPLPVLVRDDVPCRPCTLRWCPDPVCMTSLSPDPVFARAVALLRP